MGRLKQVSMQAQCSDFVQPFFENCAHQKTEPSVSEIRTSVSSICRVSNTTGRSRWVPQKMAAPKSRRRCGFYATSRQARVNLRTKHQALQEPPICTPLLATSCVPLDFLWIAGRGCSGARAVGDPCSFRDQFWGAPATPDMRFPRKKVLHVKKIVPCL